MREIVRTNDPVFLSWLSAALKEAGIEAVVLDSHTAIMEGSIAAIQRRVMVDESDLARARALVAEGENLRCGKGGAW